MAVIKICCDELRSTCSELNPNNVYICEQLSVADLSSVIVVDLCMVMSQVMRHGGRACIREKIIVTIIIIVIFIIKIILLGFDT
jgi:hypothetical protein